MFTQGALNQEKVTRSIIQKAYIYDPQPKHPGGAVIRQKIDEPYKGFIQLNPGAL